MFVVRGKACGGFAQLQAGAAGFAKSFHALLNDLLPGVGRPGLVFGEFSDWQQLVSFAWLAGTAATEQQGLTAAFAGRSLFVENCFGLGLGELPLVDLQEGFWSQQSPCRAAAARKAGQHRGLPCA